MMISRGTRGDVQPFVALARGLAQEPYNCDVTIVTELTFKKFIKGSRAGLPEGSLRYLPSGGDTARRLEGATAQWAFQAGETWDLMQTLMFSASEAEFFASEGVFFHWAQAERPDFVVFGFTLTHIAMIISEALDIPIVGFILQPTAEITQRSAPTSTSDKVFEPLRKVKFLIMGSYFQHWGQE